MSDNEQKFYGLSKNHNDENSDKDTKRIFADIKRSLSSKSGFPKGINLFHGPPGNGKSSMIWRMKRDPQEYHKMVKVPEEKIKENEKESFINSEKKTFINSEKKSLWMESMIFLIFLLFVIVKYLE